MLTVHNIINFEYIYIYSVCSPLELNGHISGYFIRFGIPHFQKELDQFNNLSNNNFLLTF